MLLSMNADIITKVSSTLEKEWKIYLEPWNSYRNKLGGESRLRAEMQAPGYFLDVGFREKERTAGRLLR